MINSVDNVFEMLFEKVKYALEEYHEENKDSLEENKEANNY